MQDLSVLILGSGPNVLEAREWTKHPFDKIVAINNAWAVREDWDDLIYPFDFPEERRPNALQSHQRFVTQEDFVPVQKRLWRLSIRWRNDGFYGRILGLGAI